MLSPVVVSIANERALSVLRHAYTERLELARGAHVGGARVIGMIGNTIPSELVLASGAHPVLVTADLSRPTPHSDVFMEAIIPPETRALLEAAASGELAFLELLVLSRPYAHLYYYLKEVYRLGHGKLFPPIAMFDLMHSRREAVRAYNWGRLEALIARLERAYGQEITESRLREAIALTNTVRALQRRLLEHRWQGLVSGVDALTAIGAAYFMDSNAYLSALENYVAQLATEPAQKPRLLVVTSEPLSHTRLHEALESAGAIVVAEDDWWGSRAPGADIPFAGSAREAIFHKYWLDTASPGVYPATAREAWLREHALRPDVDGVVIYLPPSDHQLGWDYPRVREWLAQHRKPSFLVREEATRPDGANTIRENTRGFLESLQ
jgi:benzoyl-CoA reductase/2-hydroxyglutaryl-CoA dehydratase subunit BcrC/BadD/HgdB